VGGGWEEEALKRLQELAGIGPEKVELTEEVRANVQRQEDEVMRFLTLFLVSPSLRFVNYSLLHCQA
jgi:hypothetical protein